jgi:hypothetical protein
MSHIAPTRTDLRQRQVAGPIAPLSMNSASGHPLRHRARGGQVNCFTIPTARSGSTEFAWV